MPGLAPSALPILGTVPSAPGPTSSGVPDREPDSHSRSCDCWNPGADDARDTGFMVADTSLYLLSFNAGINCPLGR